MSNGLRTVHSSKNGGLSIVIAFHDRDRSGAALTRSRRTGGKRWLDARGLLRWPTGGRSPCKRADLRHNQAGRGRVGKGRAGRGWAEWGGAGRGKVQDRGVDPVCGINSNFVAKTGGVILRCSGTSCSPHNAELSCLHTTQNGLNLCCEHHGTKFATCGKASYSL